MKLLPHWVLNDTHPAFYDSESKTVIEQTARVYGAMRQLITEYNEFVDQVNTAWEEYKQTDMEDDDLFQRKMEQLFHDFVKTVELKYQSQDVYLQKAVEEIIAGIPDALAKALDQLYTSGEFDIIVYNSIANLKSDFDKIVNNTNTFQSNINKSFSNLVTDMETFKSNTVTDFENLEAELNQKFNDLVLDNVSADMQKAVYDTDYNGIVDDSEKLGGQIPSYYAKQQDLDTVKVNMETMNVSLNSTIKQIETVQDTSNRANSTATTAKTTADNALAQAQAKLGKAETAVDSNKLGGKDASDYAPAGNGITIYTHGKTGVVHYLNGSGNNIKFTTTADWNPGDTLMVNGVECRCWNEKAERIEGKKLFSKGVVITATLSWATTSEVWNCFFKSGGTGLNFSVVNGTTQPVSPAENTIWVNTSTAISKWSIVGAVPTTAGASGDVAIVAKLEPGFNIVDDNSFCITPVKAYQYISGAWTQKELQYYMNGSWYSNALVFTASNWTPAGTTKVTDVNGSVRIECVTASEYSDATLNDKIDLTGINEIKVTVSGVKGNMGSAFYTLFTVTQEKPTGNIYATGDVAIINGVGDVSLNTESLTGEYWLTVQAGYQVGTYIEISDIQLI